MQRINQILKKYPLFLISLPLVFYLNTANHYYGLLNWKILWIDLLIYFFIPIVVYFLFAWIFRSKAKAGAIMFYLLLIFYFFHVLHQWLKEMPALNFLSSYSVLLPIILIVTIIYLVYVFRQKGKLSRLYYLGNLFFILLLVAGIVQYSYNVFSHAERQHFQASVPDSLQLSKPVLCDTCLRPDIHFIILDGYSNAKALNTEFGYSNEELLNYLKEKKFYVVQNSRSNYNFTHMSIASMLHMDYLRRLDNTHSFYTKDFFQSNYTIYHNPLTKWLKQKGYELNNYSIFDVRDASSKISPFLQELNYRSVFGQTFFNKLKRDIGYHFSFLQPGPDLTKEESKKINTGLLRIRESYYGVLKASYSSPQIPRFTYAHFILPHETFYFDSTGKKLDPLYTARTMINKKDYLQQLVYTNKFIVKPLVDSIFHNSKRPFVIIIQGDHGYRNYEPEKKELEFENLSAFYFSNQNYGQLHDSISSVNAFRVVLNSNLDQRLPLLKDSTINLSK